MQHLKRVRNRETLHAGFLFMAAFYLSNRYRHRCFCGRFITLSKRYGWEAGGEFGEETFYICSRCLDEGATPQGHNGSSDARWCGVVNSDE